MHFEVLLISLLAGIVAVTLVDSIGSFASRKLNFRYSYLAILSLAIYLAIGYFVSREAGLSMAMLVAMIVGFYDATIGFRLSKICGANFTEQEKEILQLITTEFSLAMMLVISLFFSFLGYLLGWLSHS